MKGSLYFRQQKPITAYILGGLLLLVGISLLLAHRLVLTRAVVLFVIAFLLFSYSISYEINSEFKNSKHYKLVGLTILKIKMDMAFPEYITVFSARFKAGAEWGPVSAMGKARNSEGVVVRMFSGNKNFTVFRTKSSQEAKKKAAELSELLMVKLIDKT